VHECCQSKRSSKRYLKSYVLLGCILQVYTIDISLKSTIRYDVDAIARCKLRVSISMLTSSHTRPDHARTCTPITKRPSSKANDLEKVLTAKPAQSPMIISVILQIALLTIPIIEPLLICLTAFGFNCRFGSTELVIGLESSRVGRWRAIWKVAREVPRPNPRARGRIRGRRKTDAIVNWRIGGLEDWWVGGLVGWWIWGNVLAAKLKSRIDVDVDFDFAK